MSPDLVYDAAKLLAQKLYSGAEFDDLADYERLAFLDAAEAVLQMQEFRNKLVLAATTEKIAASETMIGSKCPMCDGRGADEHGGTCLHCGGQGGPKFIPYEDQE